MTDERVGKLARLLVDYSLEAGEGDQVLISGEVGAGPLIKALYARLLQAGATPVAQVGLPGMQEIFFEHAGELHYQEIPQVTRALYEEVDAQIGILSPSNTRALANVDPEKQQMLQKRNKPLSEMMLEKDRWVLTLFPTEALAQEAHMSLSEYEEFAFEAMGLYEEDPVRYWSEKSAEQERLKEGKVVEASAERGEEYLFSLLEADAGARYLGELGIGTNYGIRRASANVLFDEKLGGTVHLAIGRSYAETGGQNESSVHTDLVCDLRDGGELYADGDLIQENGRFLEFDLAGATNER